MPLGITPAQRWEYCRGVIHVRLQLDVLAARAVKRVVIDDVYVTFADVTPNTNVNYIVATDSDGAHIDPVEVALMSSSIRETISFIFTGRLWEARFAASTRFVSDRTSSTPYIVQAGFAVMFLLAIAGL
jgi:hypothetical protein